MSPRVVAYPTCFVFWILTLTSASAQISPCMARVQAQCQRHSLMVPVPYRANEYQQCIARFSHTCRAPASHAPSATADPRIVQIVRRIMATMCPSGRCGTVRVVANPNEKQLASARSNGQGYTMLSYSPKAMARIVQQWGWQALVGTMAHEIGHHFDFNSSPWAAMMRTVRDRELRADMFAGCTMAKLGLTSGALENAVLVIGRYPTHGYPHGHNRAASVRQGFLQCGGMGWPRRMGSSF